MFVLQQTLIDASWVVYFLYMASVPLWLAACALEMYWHTSRKLPTAFQYMSVRIFLFYVVMDSLRIIDLCFATDAQFTDGICRSIWSVQPLWLRALAWWARDMAMLGGLACLLQFALQWTHTALGRPLPHRKLFWLRLAIGLVMLEMSVCAACLLASNRFIWMFGLLLGVIGMNFVSSSISADLLWTILPEVRQKLGKGAEVGTLASAVISQATLVSWTSLALAAVVLGVFLPLSFTRLLDGALEWSLIPGVPQGKWIGNSYFPQLSRMPSDAPTVMPNPAIELVELTIGWFLCTSMLMSPGCGYVERPPCGYIAAKDLGAMFERDASAKNE